MRLLLATAILASCSASTALARGTSLDYSILNGPRFCELRVGTPVPRKLALLRRYRQYVESGDYNVIRIYGACGGRVPTEVLLIGNAVSDIVIKKKELCVDGNVCIGDSLAAARERLPQAKIFALEEEGQVLYLRLSPLVTLGVQVKDLQLDCPEIPDNKCLRQALARPISDITISNRIKP